MSLPLASTSVTATDILRSEIQQFGPISLERFMDVALYHPQLGYYRKSRDPFGRNGDFYTASQLQPSFGRLIRAVLEKLPVTHTLIEIGSGRGEMQEQFQSWKYIAVDAGDRFPEKQEGVIFTNELFDALPCRVYDLNGDEVLVDFEADHFVWTGNPHREKSLRSFKMLDEMSDILLSGYLVIIDYGYNEHERAARFPNGTLMSYHRHTASEDVLLNPGERDITAHVNFTEIERYAMSIGFERVKRSSLVSFLLEGGEDVLNELAHHHAQQLKSLLFGMGEAFEVLLLKRTNSP